MPGEFPTQVIGEVRTYQISNICQLQNLSAFLEMQFVPANPTFRLGADIDAGETQTPRWNNGKGFAPIGATYSVTGQRTDSPDSPGFSGTFDGRGYRISNLFIYRLGEEDVGLFARLSAAADIRNLTFFDAKVTGSTGVGILAGRALDSTISNITVTNSVVTGGELVGSITGDLHRSGVFPARVTASTITGQADVGGVVGRAADSTISRITVTGSVVTGSTRVGTLAGSVADSTISRITAAGSVVTGDTRVGGVVGRVADSTISRITVTDSVVAGDTRVGGVVGRAADSTISRITATNSVVTGGELVGGVIGELRGISASLSAARVRASTITGRFGAGGVAGHLLDGRITTVRVTDSTIRAEREGGGVTGFVGGGMVQGSEAIEIVVTGSDEAEGRELGGLVGHLLEGGVIRQSYATGVVGDPERDYEVGGLVGHVREGALVENSYAWVRVGGDGSVGGLVGVNQSTISNSYAYSVVTPRNPSGLTGLSIFVGLNGQVGADIQSVESEEQGGTIEGSYAAGTVNGEIPTTLAGDNSGAITGSSTRTLSQLRCPTASSRFCAEGEPETFAGWDSDIWYFGSTHTLPALKALTRIPATPTDVSLEWSTTNSLVLRAASVATYYELGLEVGESSTVLLARSPNFELGDLSRELRGNLAGGDSVSYTVRISSETRVVNPPSGDGNVNTQIVTEIVSPPFFGSFTLLDVPGTPTVVTALDVTADSAADRKVRVTVSGPDNDGYGRELTDSGYGSKVNGVDLNFAYVVKVLDGSGLEIASTVQETTSTSVMIVLDGLRAGTQYTVKASARNVVGSGGTLEGEFTTSAGVPDAPIIVSSWENTQSLVSSWTAPYDGGSTITAYVVTVGGGTEAESRTRLDSDSTMLVVDPSTLRSVFQGGDSIAYSVQAVNAEGVGNPFTGTFVLLGVPGTPTAVTASDVTAGSAVAREVQVTVNAPDNDGYGRKATNTTTYGSIVDKVALNFAYAVKVLDGSGIEIASTIRKTTSTSVMVVLGGLSAGTQYTVRAFVQNTVGPGGALEGTFKTNAVKPGTPELLDPVWKSAQSLVLSWTAPHNGGSTITTYVVIVDDMPIQLGSTTMHVVVPTTLRSDFRGGATITYSVQAVNAAGDGSPSTSKFTLLDVPGMPTVVTASDVTAGSAATRKVQVTVNAPDNDGYGRGPADSDYGSKVGEVDLDFAYVVKVLDGSGKEVASTVQETTLTSVVIVFDGLRAGTQYRTVTSARNVVGEGNAIEEALTTSVGVPETPMTASSWGTTQSLVLSWTAPHHGGSAITTYVVTVGDDMPVRLGSDSTKYDVIPTTLRSVFQGGDTITYSVQAANAEGGGNPFTGTFVLLDVPGTPTVVTASDVTAGSAVTRKVRVTVSGPDNDGYGRQAADSDYGSQVDGVDLNFAYVVKILDGSGIEVASTVQETTLTSVMIVFDGLRAGAQYTVKASARNAVGAGGTLEGEFTTSAGVPDAPIIAPFWENTLRVVFSWEAPYDGGSTITSYRRRTLGSGGFQTLPATQTRFVFDTHEPIDLGSSQGGLKGVAFFLRAVNDIGAGSESTAAFAFLDVPGAPTTVTVSGSGANTVRVTVNGPGNDGYGRGPTDPDYGTQVDGVVLNFAYVVKVLDGSGIEIASTVRKTASTSVMIDFDGLSAGTQYTVRAFVRNVLGSGGVRMRSFTTSAGVPEAPMTASSWGTTQSLVLSWSAPHHGGSTITAYVVTVGGGTEAESTTRLDSGSTMLVVDPSTLRSVFQGGDSIAYSVQAVNAEGVGSPFTGTFVLLGVPGTPTSVTATGIGTTTVQVTVNAPDNDGYGRKATNTTTYGSIVDKVALNFAYVVNVTDVINGDSVSSMTKATTATSVTLVLGGLKVGTQYQIVTFVQNAVGASDSLEGAFKTNAVEPGMPELLDPVWKSTQRVVLSWTAPHNGGSTITTYVVTVNDTAPIQLGSTTMYVVVPTTLRSDFQGGDTIAYTVRALNAVGSGSTANETFTLLDVPGTPTVVTASDVTAGSAATRKVRVMVSGPDNDGYGREPADPDYGSKVGEVDLDFTYVVKVLDGSGKEVASMVRVTTLTSVMIVFDGLRAGTQYRTVTSARNAVGAGGTLEGEFTTSAGVPDAPIVVSFWETTLKEVFSWDEPYDGGSAITKYNLFGGEIGPHDIEIIAPETTFAFSIPAEHRVDAYADFQGGYTITYSVRATNDIGAGGAGTVVSTILNVPSAPTTVTVSGSGANTVRVTVIGSDNDGYGRKATDPDYGSTVDDKVALNLTYVVKVLDGSGIEIASTSRKTTSTSVMIDFDGLRAGIQYTVRAFVQNTVGPSGARMRLLQQVPAYQKEQLRPGQPRKPGVELDSTPSWRIRHYAYVVTVGGAEAESTTRLDSASTMLVVDPSTLRSVFQGGDSIAYSVQAVNAAGEGSLSTGTFVLLDVRAHQHLLLLQG